MRSRLDAFSLTTQSQIKLSRRIRKGCLLQSQYLDWNPKGLLASLLQARLRRRMREQCVSGWRNLAPGKEHCTGQGNHQTLTRSTREVVDSRPCLMRLRLLRVCRWEIQSLNAHAVSHSGTEPDSACVSQAAKALSALVCFLLEKRTVVHARSTEVR